MNRREASKIETRKLIIAAARKLLLEGSHTEFTMRRIAKEAGVSAASVVVHLALRSTNGSPRTASRAVLWDRISAMPI